MMATQKAEALFDFQPTAEVELKMQKGDVVIVRRMSVGDGWWEGELGGTRGLFPSSFVKLLPAVRESIDAAPVTPPLPSIPPPPPPATLSPSSRPATAIQLTVRPTPTPLTPRTSKKAFMETMLSPDSSKLDQIYDKDKAAELYVPGSTEIAITVGPRWSVRPPMLTIRVREPQKESRFSGIKHVTLHQVETLELGSSVSRRYKHFLWLYDRLAENFPCISLPPLPVKQALGTENKDFRRRGLEKFLSNVARHPVLGCTKILKVFLTDEDSKHDKEWKIGKHMSHLSHNTKLPKISRKLFSAPVYCTVKYPPFNVPVSQLASIEKFSKFSRLLEMNVNTVHMACGGLSMGQRDMVTSVNLLAKDLRCFAQGKQPSTGAQRRKLQATATGTPTTIISNGPPTFYAPTPGVDGVGGQEVEEENSGGEESEGGASWNWRDDDNFNIMAHDLQDLARGMERTSRIYHTHQEIMGAEVMEALQEYSGTINTLPGLVRLHEEAMELYNFSKDKDSKQVAEEVRRNCETLNNILLAEFDYFSGHLVESFEAMMVRFLDQQADFHRKMADEWESMHSRYKDKVSQKSSASPSHRFPSSSAPKGPSSSSSHPFLSNILHSVSNTQRTLSSHISPPSSSPSSPSSPSTTHQTTSGRSDRYTPPPEKAPLLPQASPSHNLHTTLTAHNSRSSGGMELRPNTTTDSETDSPCSSDPLRSYVNVNVDDPTSFGKEGGDEGGGGEEKRYSRKLRSLSPLEASIERELERNQDRGLVSSTESDYAPLTIQKDGEESRKMTTKQNGEDDDETPAHGYANWQIAQMQGKKVARASSSETLISSTSPPKKPQRLFNGGSASQSKQETGNGKQETVTTLPEPTSPRSRNSAVIPAKPPKPPAYKLKSKVKESLSHKYTIDSAPSTAPPLSTSVPTTPLITGTPPTPGPYQGSATKVLPYIGHGTAHKFPTISSITATDAKDIHKGFSIPEDQDILPSRTIGSDRFLPSQMMKPRSNALLSSHTGTNTVAEKKKPILPPPPRTARSSLHSHTRFPVVKEINEVIQERQELLESSGELERSGGWGGGGGGGGSGGEISKGSRSPKPVRASHIGFRTAQVAPSTDNISTGVKMSGRNSTQGSPTSELLRKLSLRRQKLDQQLGSPSSAHTSRTSSMGVDGSSRCTSSSSTASEFVCSYNVKRNTDDLSPQGRLGEEEEEAAEEAEGEEGVHFREEEEEEDENLVRYGIEEDFDGGSYVI